MDINNEKNPIQEQVRYRLDQAPAREHGREIVNSHSGFQEMMEFEVELKR